MSQITSPPKPFKGCFLAQNAGQSLPAGTYTALSFNAVVYDTDGFYDAAEPTRITIPAGVKKIRLSGGVRIGSTRIGFRIYKNGGLATYGILADNYDYVTCFGTCVLEVEEGDYFEMQASSGTAQTTMTAHTYYNCEVVE